MLGGIVRQNEAVPKDGVKCWIARPDPKFQVCKDAILGWVVQEIDMPTAKKKSSKKSAATKVSWSDTMKKALEKKRPAGGFPEQAKPRDSGKQPVRKNAF